MAKKRRAKTSLPGRVLFNLYWHFGGGKAFADAATFSAEVRKRQIEAAERDSWRPDDPVLHAARIHISYHGLAKPSDREYTQYVVELSATNGSFFTAGDLLFKLHNAVIQRLRGADHCHFEGLVLKRKSTAGQPPLYEMVQGS